MTMNHTTTEQELDVIRATPKSRRRAALLVGFTLGLALPFLFFVLPLLNRSVNPLPSPSEITVIKGLLVSIAALGVVTSAVVLQFGRKILRSGQCPPNDTWVWRDTKIQRGEQARRLAWAYIISALISGILCIGLVVYSLVVLGRVSAQTPIKLPQGVKLIEQKSLPGDK